MAHRRCATEVVPDRRHAIGRARGREANSMEEGGHTLPRITSAVALRVFEIVIVVEGWRVERICERAWRKFGLVRLILEVKE